MLKSPQTMLYLNEMIITVTVLVAFLFRPMRLDGKHIFMVEWSGGRAWSMQPVPIFLPNGSAANLSAEIGPGSVIRLSLVQHGEHQVVKAVELLDHRVINPFQIAG